MKRVEKLVTISYKFLYSYVVYESLFMFCILNAISEWIAQVTMYACRFLGQARWVEKVFLTLSKYSTPPPPGGEVFKEGHDCLCKRKGWKCWEFVFWAVHFHFLHLIFSWKITILSCFLVISSPAALYLPFSLNNPFQFWLHNLLWQTIPNHTKPNQILTKFHNNDQILQSQQKFIIQIQLLHFLLLLLPLDYSFERCERKILSAASSIPRVNIFFKQLYFRFSKCSLWRFCRF